jgi:hypothetical protein
VRRAVTIWWTNKRDKKGMQAKEGKEIKRGR